MHCTVAITSLIRHTEGRSGWVGIGSWWRIETVYLREATRRAFVFGAIVRHLGLQFSSVEFRPVIAPVGWGHLLRCIWNQVAEMYGLAQLGHLKQPRSPACPTNRPNEQLWLNSSLLSSSEASRPAKLQMWLTSSAKSATRVRWRPRLFFSFAITASCG